MYTIVPGNFNHNYYDNQSIAHSIPVINSVVFV